MLLMLLSLGGTILAATTLAGFLMVSQIRSSTDFANSAKSIFAADAGTEWALDNYFNSSTQPVLFPFSPSNGATSSVTCYGFDDSGNLLPLITSTCNDANPNASSGYAIAVGTANNTNRALKYIFNSP